MTMFCVFISYPCFCYDARQVFWFFREAGMKSVVIYIDGMTCNGCVNGVKKALAALPVAEVEVSLAGQCASLQFDESQTSVDALIEAIENAGFDARV